MTGVAFFLHYLLTIQETKQMEQKISSQLIATEAKIQNKLALEIDGLQGFVSGWEFRRGYDRLEWENDISNYLKTRSGYQAIEWVDKDYFIRWVVPEKGNENAVDLYLAFEEKRANALSIATQTKSTYISPKVDLVQGVKGFIVYNPIFIDDEFEGLILGVFNINSFFYRLLRDESIAGYQVFIYDNNSLIYSTTYTEEKDNIWWRSSRVFTYRGIRWEIVLIPNGTLINESKSPLPLVVLIAGLTISWLLVWGVNSLLEVSQRNILLEKARKEAEQANNAKSQFLAMMSHEIRTPLNGLFGILNLLKSTPLNSEQKDFIQTIEDSSKSLLLIINDILDFSKIESGKLELVIEDFNLQKCIKNVIDLLSFQAKSQGLDLKLFWDSDTPINLRGDVGRLRQVLINLISNALKFTEEGEVTVTVSSRRLQGVLDGTLEGNKDYLIHFAVKDTGIGIAKENQDKLFNPFVQADGAINRRYGGTGLGLVISRRLARLMGGDIWFKSELGVGSTFYFTVKVDSAPCETDSVGIAPKSVSGEITPCQNHDKQESPINYPLAKTVTINNHTSPSQTLENSLKILIAEDNPVNQKVALLLLKKLGYYPHIAINGLEVLDAVKKDCYDVILMDMQMPEMDGLSATEWIRINVDSTMQPYIIAMTANATKADEKRCFEAGMDDYISKPFEFQVLTEKLNLLEMAISQV
ncbi:histidine kinase [Cyanobacterium stanieri PCC 7202]|uniref:Circadian input-output histidine kinase CikA n=1 Tax=Cyanobacterium stanieri (strain ATCC 29140 / PCC 7202) TaxID=292563 RepID=K9YPC9_CYASC|nr:histidine kinase [Cyanobacterium stanieri PCC 7202]